MTYRKKLIEVALPLEAINIASAREKSIRHGHPSTLHLWWARRPLAACRAVLFASLVDDPNSDPAFDSWKGEEREHRRGEKRQQLFDLITELVQWDNSNNELIINAARAEIARCVASRKLELGELKKDHKLPGGETVYDLVVKGHGDLAKLREGKARLPNSESVNAFLAEYAPPVLDPFCGGGSIPLEAQRLGLRAYGSDLNPVPVLITKALIEFPPMFTNKPPVNPESRSDAGPAGKKGAGKGKSVFEKPEWRGAQGLAEDVRYYGKWMRDEAEKRIGHLYPKMKVTVEMAKDRPDLRPYVGEDLTIIAWMWARTVASPNPALGGAHVPLVRSFWLSTRRGREVWIEPIVDRENNSYRFEVRTGAPPAGHDPRNATIVRTGGKCLLSNQPMPFEHIRAEGKAGRMKARLMALVAETPNSRLYLSPSIEQATVAESASPKNFPDTDLPKQALSMRVMLYGMDKHHKLFSQRQLVAMTTLCDLVPETRERVLADARMATSLENDPRPLDQGGVGPTGYADAVAMYLGLGVGKVADRNTTLCSWEPGMDRLRSTFGRQALPMIWDYSETNPLADSAGDVFSAMNTVAKVLERLVADAPGYVQQIDATSAAEGLRPIFSTDPPYYDNIGYADLSDFFYVWLRRAIGRQFPSLFSTLLTPKAKELIATPYRHDGSRAKAQQFFEHGLGDVFARIRRCGVTDIPLTVFYAFKQSEETEDNEVGGGAGSVATSTGWETILEAMIRSGFSIEGTWPMRTEATGRMVGIGTNALASSIVLSCRPRPTEASLATRREFLSALKRELPESLKHLQRGSIAPVDLAQAAIGPGMAVFTRYAKVMEADGSPMKVRQALSLINQTLDEVLAEQEGEFDGDTRWALAWFEQFGVDEGAFGVAETLSKAKNTAVNALVESGIVLARGGKVRLVKRDELPDDWNPATDTRLRHWEVVQHLIRALESGGGETAAANLLRRVGGVGEVARDLAYRLYHICERKGWASEALAYNGLVIAWPEITKLAQSSGTPQTSQTEMF